MSISICLDDVIDPTAVLDRIWSVVHDHVRCLTRCMDMDIPESKYSLENPCCMSIDLLYSIEWAFRHASRKGWDLVYTNDSRVCDDEYVELIIDPVEKDKCEKYDPVERESSPVESTSYEVDDNALVIQ